MQSGDTSRVYVVSSFIGMTDIFNYVWPAEALVSKWYFGHTNKGNVSESNFYRIKDMAYLRCVT